MSVLDFPPSKRSPPKQRPGHVPPLENGDRLSGDEFMRRYEAMPNVKAELINGIVYMASPVRHTTHGKPHLVLSTWLGLYLAGHPELSGGDNATVILGEANHVQPDLYLLRPASLGGRAVIRDDGYIVGPPDLVIEISASTAGLDAGEKAERYFRAGVAEYLLWRTEDADVDWFARHPDRYHPIPPRDDGMIESRVFPGLRLDADALLAGDLRKVLAAVQDT